MLLPRDFVSYLARQIVRRLSGSAIETAAPDKVSALVMTAAGTTAVTVLFAGWFRFGREHLPAAGLQARALRPLLHPLRGVRGVHGAPPPP